MLSAVIKQPDINNLRAKGFDLSYSFRDMFIHHQGREDIAAGRESHSRQEEKARGSHRICTQKGEST